MPPKRNFNENGVHGEFWEHTYPYEKKFDNPENCRESDPPVRDDFVLKVIHKNGEEHPEKERAQSERDCAIEGGPRRLGEVESVEPGETSGNERGGELYRGVLGRDARRAPATAAALEDVREHRNELFPGERLPAGETHGPASQSHPGTTAINKDVEKTADTQAKDGSKENSKKHKCVVSITKTALRRLLLY